MVSVGTAQRRQENVSATRGPRGGDRRGWEGEEENQEFTSQPPKRSENEEGGDRQGSMLLEVRNLRNAEKDI